MENIESNISKNNHKPIFVYDEMSSSYLSYAMSVIVSRALPDVRAGLKPVHSRIIYAIKCSFVEVNCFSTTIITY